MVDAKRVRDAGQLTPGWRRCLPGRALGSRFSIRVTRSAPRTQTQSVKAAGWFEEGSPAVAQSCGTSAEDTQEGVSDSPHKRCGSRGIEQSAHVPLSDDHDRQKSDTFRRAFLGRRNTSIHGKAPSWRASCAGGVNSMRADFKASNSGRGAGRSCRIWPQNEGPASLTARLPDVERSARERQACRAGRAGRGAERSRKEWSICLSDSRADSVPVLRSCVGPELCVQVGGSVCRHASSYSAHTGYMTTWMAATESGIWAWKRLWRQQQRRRRRFGWHEGHPGLSRTCGSPVRPKCLGGKIMQLRKRFSERSAPGIFWAQCITAASSATPGRSAHVPEEPDKQQSAQNSETF